MNSMEPCIEELISRAVDQQALLTLEANRFGYYRSLPDQESQDIFLNKIRLVRRIDSKHSLSQLSLSVACRLQDVDATGIHQSSMLDTKKIFQLLDE